jgi:hypothetical protein
MRRRTAATALALLVFVVAGCSGSKSSAAAPPDPSPSPGLGLRLTPTQVPAGGLFDLRLEGEEAAASDMSVAADFQRWDGRSWRTEFLLDAWGAGDNRPVAVPAGELHFVVDIAPARCRELDRRRDGGARYRPGLR